MSMRASKSAFTLVEILIVVIILGILAGIVIPNITGVTVISRETNLKENLSKIRAQVQVYRQQHASFPEGTEFVDQMTKYTDFDGDVADTQSGDYRYGPYLEQMPSNPVTMDATIRTTSDPAGRYPPGDQNGGWWYNEVTGDFYADLTDVHVDNEGNPYNRF
ncbi:MAG: prepilin-type N-terminal cleavage/methylation domain-containing protein [Planctomycetes bacterium]|nr:prepilin-type N-terminal cleavage/methylation domain-containing protein [Planctomycetota bacterium]